MSNSGPFKHHTLTFIFGPVEKKEPQSSLELFLEDLFLIQVWF